MLRVPTGSDTTNFILHIVVGTWKIRELINKGIPPFCSIIYETGLANGDKSYIGKIETAKRVTNVSGIVRIQKNQQKRRPLL